jgi:uncharacterized membrane protein YphA (DoxX/SURF4 family)
MDRRYGLWLALIRIVAGLFWFTHGLAKVSTPAFVNRQMPQNVGRGAGAIGGFYHQFLVGTVLPHAHVFAYLAEWGELLVGVSLLLGLLTPLGAAVGMWLTLNYWMLAGGWRMPEGLWGNPFLAFLLSFTMLVLPAGAFVSVDALLRTRRVTSRKITRTG